jgi:hypothetical protein
MRRSVNCIDVLDSQGRIMQLSHYMQFVDIALRVVGGLVHILDIDSLSLSLSLSLSSLVVDAGLGAA